MLVLRKRLKRDKLNRTCNRSTSNVDLLHVLLSLSMPIMLIGLGLILILRKRLKRDKLNRTCNRSTLLVSNHGDTYIVTNISLLLTTIPICHIKQKLLLTVSVYIIY
jgi:hypothetical protein